MQLFPVSRIAWRSDVVLPVCTCCRWYCNALNDFGVEVFVSTSLLQVKKVSGNPAIACVSMFRYYVCVCVCACACARDRILDVISARGRCHRASYLWRTEESTNGSASRQYNARALRNIPCRRDKALLRTHKNRSLFWTRAATDRERRTSGLKRAESVEGGGQDILVLVVRELFVLCELCLCRLWRHLCTCLMLV